MILDKYFNTLQGVRKTPKGYNSYCPYGWHEPKNSRSFHVNLEEGFTKCFSCGTYKPLFDFLIYYKVPFDIAAEYIFHTPKIAREAIEMENFIFGIAIPKSLLDRGFTVETLQYFEVGYDTYEERITIPLRMGGKLYGAGYRKYPKDFSHNPDFSKDNYIYNYEITKERTIVEGYSDTWRVWQNGTKEVSATLTANPGKNQLNLLRKFEVLNLAYDFDFAGIEGMFNIHHALKYDCEINVVLYNSGQEKNDPGACGVEQWNNRTIIPFVEFEILIEKNYPEIHKKLKEKLFYLKKSF